MKLHIGCGKRYLDGFMHIDIQYYPHVNYVCDARNLTMINNDSVDLIYASHILEHFHYTEAPDVLKEWCRVLKPETGILRLAVPDFDAILSVYAKYKDLNMIMGLIYGTRSNPNNSCHTHIYNLSTLACVLEECGFSDIHLWNWRECLPKEFDDYSKAYIPHMDFDNGLSVSLNVEGTKLKQVHTTDI